METESRTRRDAATVEISYAVVSGAVIAALVYFSVIAPTMIWDLSKGKDSTLKGIAAVFALMAFSVRVVVLLVRFGEALRERDGQR